MVCAATVNKQQKVAVSTGQLHQTQKGAGYGGLR